MSEKQKTDSTVITLVLPPTDNEAQATVTVKQGDLGHLSAFDYTDFGDLCRALNRALAAFVQVQADPPKVVKPARPASTSEKKSKKQDAQPKPAGKPPYHLLDASGKRRTVTMIDPFDVQETYQSDNPKLSFDALDEALDVARQLVAAGDKQITVVYANGKAVKVLPEAETDTTSDAQQDTASMTDDETQSSDPADDPVATAPVDEKVAVGETETEGTDDLQAEADEEKTEGESGLNDEDGDDGETDPKTAQDATTSEQSEGDTVAEPSYPAAIDSAAKRAFYDVLADETLTLSIFDDIQTLRQHGWKEHVIKQRQVKGLIAAYLDDKDDLIEQVYQIAHTAAEFDDASEPIPSHSQ